MAFIAIKETTKKLSGQILSFTDWVSRQLHISSKWAPRYGFLVLWGVGMTLIQVEEYFFALICWLLSSVVLFAKAIHWSCINARPRATILVRLLCILGSVAFAVMSITWTEAKRNDRPWGSLFGSSIVVSPTESFVLRNGEWTGKTNVLGASKHPDEALESNGSVALEFKIPK